MSATVPTSVSSQEPDSEATWLRDVYRGNERQLTVRSVIVGVGIGAVMCLSNLYVFFKTGWSLGVTLTAAILAFSVFRLLSATGIVKTPLSALENNALTTVASGAGYMTAGGNMAALGALLMVTEVRPGPLSLIAWFGVISALGVFVAIPIKRQLINREALPFPTGVATAATIRSIHGEGTGDSRAGSVQAKALYISALIAGLLTWMRDAKASFMVWNLPKQIALPFSLGGVAAKDLTLALKTELVLVGAGALMSFRTGWSILLGGMLTYAVLSPSLLAQGIVAEPGYRSLVGWTLWPGAAILVGAGLTSFVLDGKSILRAFSGMRGVLGGARGGPDPMNSVECPSYWFPLGFAALAPVCVFLMATLFQIPVWACLIAVPLSLVMGFIAARVTGETDVTPTKALGPVTQLLYGILTPGNLAGNIMSANVTGGIGLHAADLLTTLKTGWLLGARPRAQFYAQLFGVAAGAVIIVPAFDLLIPDPSTLGSESWPAPSCLVWAGVSKAFAGGIGALHPTARTAAIVGLGLGVALALIEKFAPPKLKPFIPSPSGVGIAMVIPGSNAISMFLGALIAEVLRRKKPEAAERYLIPVSSGVIAGESLMGVVVALLIVGGVLAK